MGATLHVIKGGQTKPEHKEVNIKLDLTKKEHLEIFRHQLRYQGMHACFKIAEEQPIGMMLCPLLAAILGKQHDICWGLIYKEFPDIEGQELTFDCTKYTIKNSTDSPDEESCPRIS